jgi:spore coat polysaccharide biosynthesis protein SpsF
MKNLGIKTTKVGIGVQARTTSTRLPGKVLMTIDGRTLVDHVLESALDSAKYINKFSHKHKIEVYRYALIPTEDTALKKHFIGREFLDLVEGPEEDVLSRYMNMVCHREFDYIVRLTSDCPLVPSPLITQMIIKAVKNQSDYMTNTMPGHETYFDGSDVEVISTDLIHYLDENTRGKDREHVTTLIKKSQLPNKFRLDHVFNRVDQSGIKLSVDTMEDFETVSDVFKSVKTKEQLWKKMHGNHTSHRF